MSFTPLILDIFAIAIPFFSALRGRKRGLIKTLAGIIVLILAFSCAGFLAKETTPYISEKYVTPYITSAVEPGTAELKESNKPTDLSAISKLFTDIGLPDTLVSDAISDFTEAMSKSIMEPIIAMTSSIAYKITYSVLFVIYFLLSLLVFSILLKVLNLAAKLPGINFVNKALGLILGLIFGYLTLIALSHILLKLGIFLTGDLIEETYILKHIMTPPFLPFLSASK